MKLSKPLSRVRLHAARYFVERILSRPEPPDTSKTDACFESLLASTPPRDTSSYAYDDLSVWKRASDRCNQLLALPGIDKRGLRVLEAGCGDGLVGKLLQTYGHDVTLTDMDDWRHDRAQDLPFIQGKLEDPLSVGHNGFDLIYSYNTFEHVEDPTQALRCLGDLLRPGGRVYLEFGPLFNSPWGMHAYRSVPIPYCQFLFSEERILQSLAEIGISDLGQERTTLQPMNRWGASQFSALWRDCGLNVEFATPAYLHSQVGWILRYPQCFRGRALDWTEVTTQLWRVCLVRNGT